MDLPGDDGSDQIGPFSRKIGGWKNTIPVFAIVDVCGYQYKWSYYEPDHQKHPQRIMYGSESYPLEAYDSWKTAERFPYVIGDFVWTAMDHLGEVSLSSSGYIPAAKKTTFKMPEGFTLPAGMNVFDMLARSPSNWPYFVATCLCNLHTKIHFDHIF
jgi:hypothetical protein